MSSRRRKQLLAATAAGLLLAAILASVLANATGSSSSNTISVPTAQIPSTPTDPHAKDRAQITTLALAYQQALHQTTSVNPCSYLDPQSRVWLTNHAKHAYVTAESCGQAAREGDVSGVGDLLPPGIDPNAIEFGTSADQVNCASETTPPTRLPPSQRSFLWAAAPWAGGAGAAVTFVRETNRWWIDVLLCR